MNNLDSITGLNSDVCICAGGRDSNGLIRIIEVDEKGKCYLADTDVERIAQRVVALLRGR